MSEIPVIKKLEESVINRIAAGEVIQRPANAIKELVENSLDAQATNIQITVKNGGLKYIQIVDNGVGIRKEDFGIVCERFTTSKLKKVEDLSSLQTYGFRGEALASMSHVAHLTIQSRTASEKCAYRAQFIDGKLVDRPKLIAGNIGTQVIIEDLFYNTNIRKNALKNASEEYQKIADVVGKYAIHNPTVGFSLKKFGENNDIRTPVGSNVVSNIRTIYGHSIARELIEFSLVDEKYKFKAEGQMTNVNYSTKKLNFLLFINHRLVDCQSLRKSIDDVYSNYLPKNMHPFFYLSLELDPKNVDVNVHPTKFEVNFLNEDEIVEIITSSIEKKILGSKNSRVHFTQAKLPVIVPTKSNDTYNKVEKVMPKDLVRTDSNNQKLDNFFNVSLKRKDDEVGDDVYLSGDKNKNRNKLEIEEKLFEESNKRFLKDNEIFETNLLSHKIETSYNENQVSNSSKYNPVGGIVIQTVEDETEKPRIECDLTTVLQLRKKIEDNCHLGLREVFSQHVFVGCINPSQNVIQHNTKLYLCNTETIMEELFYQLFMFNFQNFDSIRLSDPLSVKELSLIALDLPETGWTPEDGCKNVLAEKITEILLDKREMLNEYFSLDINENGELLGLPRLLDKHYPEMTALPMYLLRLSTEVNWESELECFDNFGRETAKFYACLEENDAEDHDWKYTTENVFYPALKDYFLPPKTFMSNASIVEVADLPNLFKVFERC